MSDIEPISDEELAEADRRYRDERTSCASYIVDHFPKMAARIREQDWSFDLWYKAEMRGIQMWRDANPGSELTIPSAARHTFWLITQIERLEAEKADLKDWLTKAIADRHGALPRTGRGIGKTVLQGVLHQLEKEG